ncbi:MAG: hypothetical protein HUU20_03595 [Pirellulales bacterium]|nr:hypothetical protein [Pirellulales bacterium]
MTAGIQEELRTFATRLLERRGALVDWPPDAPEGNAVLPDEAAHALEADSELVRLSTEPYGEGWHVNLAGDFLETSSRLLDAEPRIGTFQIKDLYLKRGDLDEAVHRAFTWLNAQVRVAATRPVRVEYHTWWFLASIASEDRWETRLPVTLNAASGAEVELPDPLALWQVEPNPSAESQMPSTYFQAEHLARSRVPQLAADFVGRMDDRLARDRRRLREYYNALLRETEHKSPRGRAKPVEPEQLEAKKRAVQLELRRKLGELDERYAMEAVLKPLVLVRTDLPSLAVDLSVHRKRARRAHTVYWNPITKHLEPVRCSRCGRATFSIAFTDDEVEPLCPTCAAK